ncbi:hypothetical protein EGT07_25540 [Herbaspirillum sp. HC18]|nr:hypothetical protein EGT07_25540 [Herbaspirillum sp. HC18]
MIRVVGRVRSIGTLRIRVRRVDMISRGRKRFALVLEFVCQPFRTKNLRTAAHHKKDKHQ